MVHYRKLRRDEDQFPNLTLSEALVQALEHRHADGSRIKDNWRHRVAQVPNIIDHYRFLNDSHHDGEILFGNTCLFSPNQLQPLIERDPDASVLDISEMRAPDGTEYLHAISYWLAIRDHFFIVQHVALQSKAMEEYLTGFFEIKHRSSAITITFSYRPSSIVIKSVTTLVTSRALRSEVWFLTQCGRLRLRNN